MTRLFYESKYESLCYVISKITNYLLSLFCLAYIVVDYAFQETYKIALLKNYKIFLVKISMQ